VKESRNFEQARLKKNKKKKEKQCKKKHFQATRLVLSREELKNEWYIVVKAF